VTLNPNRWPATDVYGHATRRRVADKNPNPPADWESFLASVTFAVP
jgi:hypothetical protein